MKQSDHIKGITAMEAIGELDESMLLEAEVDPALIPAGGARRARGERGSFNRFMSSGWAAASLSLVVALGILVGIIYAGNRAGGGTTQPAGSTPTAGTAENDQIAQTLSEGKIPLSDKEVNYTIRTEQSVYEVGVKSVTVIAKGKNPGEMITGYHAWHIESLTDPALDVVCMWTEEGIELAPIEPDQYAAWSKDVLIEDGLPAGVYRIHHQQYHETASGYVSEAHTEFAVGAEYEALLLKYQASVGTSDHVYPMYEGERPFTITATAEAGEGILTLSVHYRAKEKGVSLYRPSTRFVLVKTAGAANPEEVSAFSTSEFIEMVGPTDKNGGYAAFTKKFSISNPDAMLEGAYRIYILAYDKDAYLATYDFYWDGAEMTPIQAGGVETTPEVPPTVEKTYDISVPETIPAFSESIKVTFRATEPGKIISTARTIRLEKVNSDVTLYFLVPDTLQGFGPASPEDYAEGSQVYTLSQPGKLTGGSWRIVIYEGEAEITSTTFWVDEAVDE